MQIKKLLHVPIKKCRGCAEGSAERHKEKCTEGSAERYMEGCMEVSTEKYMEGCVKSFAEGQLPPSNH